MEQYDEFVSGACRPRTHTMFSFTAGNISSTVQSIIPGTLVATTPKCFLSITLVHHTQ
jgi:hypothetical protein